MFGFSWLNCHSWTLWKRRILKVYSLQWNLCQGRDLLILRSKFHWKVVFWLKKTLKIKKLIIRNSVPKRHWKRPSYCSLGAWATLQCLLFARLPLERQFFSRKYYFLISSLFFLYSFQVLCILLGPIYTPRNSWLSYDFVWVRIKLQRQYFVFLLNIINSPFLCKFSCVLLMLWLLVHIVLSNLVLISEQNGKRK